MGRFSTALTLVMLAIFTIMVAMAFGYPDKARFMPLVIGIPGILLCLGQLGLDVRRQLRRRAPAAEAAREPEPDARQAAIVIGAPEFGPETVGVELRSWGYFLAFVGGVLLFGFHVAIPMLVAAYLALEAKIRVIVAIPSALVFTLVVHLFFERLLKFALHEGFLTVRILKALAGS